MPKVLILIVTYNAMEWIQRCLESVLDSDGISDSIELEVIVVDNASDDGTHAFISKHFPSVRVHRLLKNIGFGRANNIGLSYAVRHNFDHVFLLNQDAYVDQETAAQLVLTQREHPEYMVISPVHLDGNGMGLDSKFAGYIKDNRVLQEAVGIYGEWGRVKSKEGRGKSKEGRVKSKEGRGKSKEGRVKGEEGRVKGVAERNGNWDSVIIPVDFVNAAAWMLNREALRIIGGFHPAFFMYAEDNNYVHRIHHAGFLIGVNPTVNIYHDRQNRPVPEGSAKLFRNYKINAGITICNPTISLWKKFSKTTKLLFRATGSRLKHGHPDAIILIFRMIGFTIGVSYNAFKSPIPTTDFPFLETSTENK